jgi:hypothetical protein
VWRSLAYRRQDLTTQMTYAGDPLYYYAHEGKNQIRCPARNYRHPPGPEPRNALPRREESGHRQARGDLHHRYQPRPAQVGRRQCAKRAVMSS